MPCEANEPGDNIPDFKRYRREMERRAFMKLFSREAKADGNNQFCIAKIGCYKSTYFQ